MATRTAAEIQKEIDALRKTTSGMSYSLMTRRGVSNNNAKIMEVQRKIAALQPELQQANYATGTIEGAAQTAMEETQRRAAADRKLALSGVTGREGQSVESITAGRKQGIESYTDVDALMKRLEAEVSEEREKEMYEQGRTGIEAGTQAGKRRLQETYARGDAPGGAMFRMMGDVEAGGQGQLSELQRNINIDRFKKLQGVTSTGAGIAGAKANIFGQEGRSLADIYQGTGRTLADIYSNTITAVPDYSKVANLGRTGGGGTTTTVSGGGFRSAPSRSSSGGFGTKSWNPGGVKWAKTKPGEPRRMTRAFGRSVGFG